MTTPTLSEPIVIAKWWKDRAGNAIQVRLSTYEGHNLIDVRTWHSGDDGVLRPTTKGIACSLKHLPTIIDALNAALRKADELGLIDTGAPPLGQRNQQHEQEEWMP
jgi:hypothetical protein